MAPADVLRILRRRWPILVAAVVIAVATGWATAPAAQEAPEPRRVTEYTGSQTLIRSTDTPTSTSQVSLPLLGRLAEMGDVPAAVVERLDLDVSPEVLAGRVELEIDQTLGLVTVSTSGTGEEQVVTLVDAYTEELLRFATERNSSLRAEALERIRRLVGEQQARVRELDAELRGLTADSIEWLLVRAERDALVTTYGQNLQTMEELVSLPPADPGLTRLGEVVAIPTSTSVFAPAPSARLPRGLTGGAIGLLLGLALAVAVDRSDRRLHTPEEVAAAYTAPILAEIELPPAPSIPAGILDSHLDDDTAQAFSRLGVAILHRASRGPEDVPAVPDGGHNGRPAPRMVLITSAAASEGRTTALVHLAGAMAATGHQVLVTGMAAHWRDAAAALSARDEGPGHLRTTALPGVQVTAEELTYPEPVDPHSPRLDGFDLVLIDAGPVLGSGDAAPLLHQVDGVLLVARLGRSDRDTAHRLRDYLDQVGVAPAGVALLRSERGWVHGGDQGPSARAVYRRRALASLRTATTQEVERSREGTWVSRSGARKR